MTLLVRALGRVLVTGAGGFLGTALLAELARRRVEVVATDYPGGAALQAGIVALDVRDAAMVQTIMERSHFDTVLHCGAVSGPMVMADRPLEIWNINATGTANVLEAARRTQAGRVVVCSTVEVYGEATTGMASETALLRPDNVYGASKAAAEQAAIAYHREHGLDAVALRFAWIYGPGRRTPTTLASLLSDSLCGATTPVVGHPEDITHYLYIDDAVDGLLRAATVQSLGEDRIFNISAGAGVPFGKILNEVRAVAPEVRIDFQAAASPARGPSGFDQTLAQARLGFRAQTPFETGIGRYLAVLRG